MAGFYILEGKLFSWGKNATGAVGNGTSVEVARPIQIGDKENWVSAYHVAAESTGNTVGNMVATDSLGDVYITGTSNSFSTVYPLSSPSSVFKLVPKTTHKFKFMAKGRSSSYYMMDNGEVTGLGYNAQKQVINSTTASFSSPQKGAYNTLKNWTKIWAPHYAFIGLHNGEMYWMGTSSSISSSTSTETGTLVKYPRYSDKTLVKLTDFAVSEATIGVAVDTNGDVFTWGSGMPTIYESTATSLKGQLRKVLGISNVAKVYANQGAAFALDKSGRLYSWGNNANYEAGTGVTGRVLSPTLIASNVAECFASMQTLTIVTKDGDVLVVGRNDTGQCGLGHTNPVLSPELLYTSTKPYVLVYNDGKMKKISSSTTWEDVGTGRITTPSLFSTKGNTLSEFNSYLNTNNKAINLFSKLQGNIEVMTAIVGTGSNTFKVKHKYKAVPMAQEVAFKNNVAIFNIKDLESKHYMFRTTDTIKALFEIDGKYYGMVDDDIGEISNKDFTHGVDLSNLSSVKDSIIRLIDGKSVNILLQIDKSVDSLGYSMYFTKLLATVDLAKVTPKVTDVNLKIVNTLPDMDIDFKNSMLSGKVTDLDVGSGVRYRVLLNGERYYPAEDDWTEWLETPCSLQVKWDSRQVKVGEENSLRIDIQDKFGNVITKDHTFEGEYTALLFTDKDGTFYTDDAGTILEYLNAGTLKQGEHTDFHEIKLVNNNPYAMTSITVETETNSSGTLVELSKNKEVDEYEEISNTLNWEDSLDYKESYTFYARVKAESDAEIKMDAEFAIVASGEAKEE